MENISVLHYVPSLEFDDDLSDDDSHSDGKKTPEVIPEKCDSPLSPSPPGSPSGKQDEHSPARASKGKEATLTKLSKAWTMVMDSAKKTKYNLLDLENQKILATMMHFFINTTVLWVSLSRDPYVNLRFFFFTKHWTALWKSGSCHMERCLWNYRIKRSCENISEIICSRLMTCTLEPSSPMTIIWPTMISRA